MTEDLEECVRRIEVAEARLEEQVKGFKDALATVQSMVSSFFDRTDTIEDTLKEIQRYGCQAGELQKARSKGESLEQRMRAVEGKPPSQPQHSTAVRVWVLLGACGGIIVGTTLDSAVAPLLAKILDQFLK